MTFSSTERQLRSSLNKLFFPSFGPAVGTIAAFGSYGVGFVARPLGGAIFGHYGDRIGRKAMLTTTILVMGLGTFLIGCASRSSSRPSPLLATTTVSMTGKNWD